MNIAPDLERKAEIILNAAHLSEILGIQQPKIAVLAAVELLNPSMEATVHAASLAKMSDRRQFTPDCVVDGPLALDNAIDPQAAKHKKISGPVAGKADVLVVPNIEAGNSLAKSLVYFSEARIAGLVMGASAPVVMVSRADTAESKLLSIASAVLVADVKRDLRLKVGKVHF